MNMPTHEQMRDALSQSKPSQHVEVLRAHEDALHPSTVTYLESLWTEQDALVDEFVSSLVYELPAGQDLLSVVRSAQHVYAVHTPRIPREAFAKVAAKLTGVLMQGIETGAVLLSSCEDVHKTLAWLQSFDWASIDEEALARLCASPDEGIAELASLCAGEEDSAYTCAHLVCQHVSEVFLRAYARHIELEFLSYDFPLHTHCPVCGSEPSLSRLRSGVAHDGGHRYLYCALCETEWHFPRLRCVSCETVHPDHLQYFYGEDDLAHRIHACSSCGSAIPVVNMHDVRGAYSNRVHTILADIRAQELVSFDRVQSFLGYQADVCAQTE